MVNFGRALEDLIFFQPSLFLDRERKKAFAYVIFMHLLNFYSTFSIKIFQKLTLSISYYSTRVFKTLFSYN